MIVFLPAVTNDTSNQLVPVLYTTHTAGYMMSRSLKDPHENDTFLKKMSKT